MDTKNLTLKLDRARWWALSNQPFYGSLGMGLADVIGNPHGKTACTDGRRIFWSPEFLEKLTDEETRFVLMHETLHCAHGHLWRLPPSEAAAQQACDYAINGTLAKLPGCKMPAGALLDARFDGKAEEEIYGALKAQEKPEEKPGDDQGDGESMPDPGACGGFGPPAQPGNGPESDQSGDQPGDGKIGAQTLREEWDQRVIQAAQAAKALGKGDVPSDLQRVLERIAAVEIDWRGELADFVKTQIGARNDWSRSARRMATAPCIYPRRRADDLGLIVAIRDTSGSIDDQLCAEFTALIASASAETGAGVIVVDCDAAIQAEYRLAPGEVAPLDAKGGGGTDFTAIPARLAELADAGERIAGVIVLTDLAGSYFHAPDFATLWLCTTGTIAQTGRTVRIHR